MPELNDKDFERLSNTIQKLEEEVRILKSSQKAKKEIQIFKAISNRLRKVFSRDNLEIFLSLTSLIISAAIAIYLGFFQ